MIRPLVAAACLTALVACGDKTFSPGTSGQDIASAPDGAGQQPDNLSQELLDKLKDVETEEEAVLLEEEIWDAWLVSGSPTVDTLMKRGLDYQTEDDLEGGGSDRLVDLIVAWGDADAIRSRVQAHLDAGADHVSVQAITAEGVRALPILRELAPSLTGL